MNESRPGRHSGKPARDHSGCVGEWVGSHQVIVCVPVCSVREKKGKGGTGGATGEALGRHWGPPPQREIRCSKGPGSLPGITTDDRPEAFPVPDGAWGMGRTWRHRSPASTSVHSLSGPSAVENGKLAPQHRPPKQIGTGSLSMVTSFVVYLH